MVKFYMEKVQMNEEITNGSIRHLLQDPGNTLKPRNGNSGTPTSA